MKSEGRRGEGGLGSLTHRNDGGRCVPGPSFLAISRLSSPRKHFPLQLTIIGAQTTLPSWHVDTHRRHACAPLATMLRGASLSRIASTFFYLILFLGMSTMKSIHNRVGQVRSIWVCIRFL